MKPNINDVSKLRDLKEALAGKNISPTAIVTLEKAIKGGMSFNGPQDLAVLDIPSADVSALRDVVVFGPRITYVPNIKTIEYRCTPIGEGQHLYGYQLVVRTEQGNGFMAVESYPIGSDNRVIVDFDLAVLRPGSNVVLSAKAADGSSTGLRLPDTGSQPRNELELPVDGLANALLEIAVVSTAFVPNPTVVEVYAVRGKLISRSETKLDGYQIVLFAATGSNESPNWLAVASARTETNGYFVTSPLLFTDPGDLLGVKAAKALVSKAEFSTELPVALLTELRDGAEPISRIPERVILVIEDDSQVGAGTVNDTGCGLNFHSKKVLEECSYYTVVRTSEPSVIADVLEDEPLVDLQDVLGVPGFVPLGVFRKYYEIQKRQSALQPLSLRTEAVADMTGAVGNVMLARTASNTVSGAGAGTFAGADRIAGAGVSMGNDTPAVPVTLAAAKLPVFNRDLMDRLLVDYKTEIVVKGTDKPKFRGRMHLGPTNQINWDEPTIFQAASIAHGHLLQFKQEWAADGYSIGDLVYSLPLAPGQKKQIAVLDWERRESAANSQLLEYEETLNNSLVRDRDIREVISGTLTENLRGNSKSSTRGLGFGLGSSVMGVIPGVGTFGSLLGISGGLSSASSAASQSSLRDMTSSSLQSITDRTQQAASVVRSQRATVVQTVSQGERVQATAESVANYNHCHAITIQYFEVLRHFTVRNRLARVQECLFVPLQMTQFNLEKSLRWRTSLERHLLRPELQKGFDAVARIQNERESAFENYYDSIGYPRRNFAEQPIRMYSGELFMEFFFFNTAAQKIDDDIIKFFTFFGISLDALRDRQITDDELARHVGPRTIEFLLDALVLQTDKGQDLRLDVTLVSSFRQNVPLRIAVAQSAQTPQSIRRQDIDAILVTLDLSRMAPDAAINLRDFQNKYMKIRLRSGRLRYRTDGLAGTLFNGSIENDIFANGDAAYLPAPLTDAELRNPRGDDVEAANALIRHLNENLEYYNRCLFFDMTPERRFMLLDGIIAPGKAQGRSVASVVENRVIGIAGNSLIMPVAPGYQLDPTIDDTFDLFAQYFHDEPEPMRISLPTRGVYAEAVMGQCNSCEIKDETRFWRWEESPIPDSPNTQILPISTDTRRADPGNLQAKDLPAPVVNIQNAPAMPDPTGMQNLIQTLGKGDVFRDVTGLQQTQLNAMGAYQSALESAGEFGREAAELAKTMAHVQLAREAQKSGTLSNEAAAKIVEKRLETPEPAEVREEINKDLEQVKQQKEKGNLDESQQKEISEDVYRKKQNIPRTRTAPKKGTRKYHIMLVIQDPNGKDLEGTWELNFGSLRDEGFETKLGDSVKTFEVELDTSRHNMFELKGNPMLLQQSFPGGSQYYYHYLRVFPVVGEDPNLSFTISQTRRWRTVTVASTVSESEAKMLAVAQESGTQSSTSVESGGLAQLIGGKVAGDITFFGKRTTTQTGTSTSGTSTTDSVTYDVELLASRLAIKQTGQPQDLLIVDDR